MTAAPSLLSKSAQRIQSFLAEKGETSRVIELSASTRTALEAAQAIGCDVAQIVKSLLFQTQTSLQPLLVLASGINRVNEKNLEALIGEKLVKADADFTRQVTGFAIGGIPPIGHTQNLKTLIDEDLLNFPEVWAAAGTPHAVFNLNSAALQNLTGGEIASIK